MMSRTRLLATVLLLAPVAFACGKKAEPPPDTTQPASHAPAAAATESPAVAAPAVAGGEGPAVAAPAVAGSEGPAVAAPAVTASEGPAVAAPAVTPAEAAAVGRAPGGVERDPDAAGRDEGAHEAAGHTSPSATPPAGATSVPPTTQADEPAATRPAPPAGPAAQRPKGEITLPAKLGAVTFDHENHAGTLGIECATCHHPSQPQMPQTSENQACRDCHAMSVTPPMKTSLQAAFHDRKGATGTCIDCHKQKGASAPVKCLECHEKK
jgi:hypothetical protein